MHHRVREVRLHRAWLAVFALMTGSSVAAQASGASTSAAVIVASGTAAKSIPADHATVDISVETRAPTAEQARRDNARVQHAVMSALRAAGADSADISTVAYFVRSGRSDGPAAPLMQEGFVSTNTVHVDVRRLDRVSAYVDTALAAGASRVIGVTFTSTATRDARRGVLAEAVANARSDAEAMASAAGGSLGRLVELSTEHGDVEEIQMRQAEIVGMLRDVDIRPHPVNVDVTVYAKWEFVPKP
jgi:hypothetical protein